MIYCELQTLTREEAEAPGGFDPFSSGHIRWAVACGDASGHHDVQRWFIITELGRGAEGGRRHIPVARDGLGLLGLYSHTETVLAINLFCLLTLLLAALLWWPTTACRGGFGGRDPSSLRKQDQAGLARGGDLGRLTENMEIPQDIG